MGYNGYIYIYRINLNTGEHMWITISFLPRMWTTSEIHPKTKPCFCIAWVLVSHGRVFIGRGIGLWTFRTVYRLHCRCASVNPTVCLALKQLNYLSPPFSDVLDKYCRWTKYSNPFYPIQPPRPQSSMLTVNVTWGAVAPMNERNHPPNITFAHKCTATLRFGSAGVQHTLCCRVLNILSTYCRVHVLLVRTKTSLYKSLFVGWKVTECLEIWVCLKIG